MPAELVGRYIQDGKHWYLPNGDKGFTDHGNRLTTRSENARIIQDFIAIARERGWDRIVVGGSKEFRRQAWREAKLERLEVTGYKPTRVEQALLIRSLASAGARGDARTESLHEPLRPGRAETLDQGREPERAAPPATGRPTPHSEPLITGRLLDHGRAPYPADPDGAQSYFVTIKRDKGENLTVWGVDLERAIRQSLTSVEIGDQIGLRSVSRRDFKLKTQRLSEDGRPVEQEVDANGWIVEQKRFFVDRAALAKAFRDQTEKPSDVVRRHPELGGTYLEFQASKLHIEKTVAHPEDRAAFLRALRERIAAAIERGEPLKPVHMKQHAPHREPGTPGANGANGHAMPDPQVLVR